MNKKDELRALFGDGFVQSFIKAAMIDVRINSYITYNACNELYDVDQNKSNRIEKLNDIMKSCGHTLRTPTLYVILQDSFSPDEILIESLDVDELLADISGGCKKRTHRMQFPVKTKPKDTVYLRTSKRFITFLIMHLVRTALSEGYEKVSFYHKSRDGKTEITLKYEKMNEDSLFTELKDDFMYQYSNEIAEVVAEKIGAELDISESGAVIRMDEYTEFEVNAYKKFMPEGKAFDMFDIMLAEFREEQVYYKLREPGEKINYEDLL